MVEAGLPSISISVAIKKLQLYCPVLDQLREINSGWLGFLGFGVLFVKGFNRKTTLDYPENPLVSNA